jgi:hypothetical protein
MICPAARGSRRNYARWRARQIAYGQWEPWAPAAPVREHVQELHRDGATIRAIARAAGVSPMTVQRLLHGEPDRCRPAPHRMRAGGARRLLAVTPVSARQVAVRRDAAGTRRRLRALTAVGYSSVSLAAATGTTPGIIRDLVSGHVSTVSAALHTAVAALYDEIWDQPPPASTGAQRRAIAAARQRAARNGWPPPMGLDDDQIDDPGYRPRTRWRPAAGTCAAPPLPGPAPCRAHRQSRPATTRGRGHTARGR